MKCRCRGLLLHLIALSDTFTYTFTHTHTHTHIHTLTHTFTHSHTHTFTHAFTHSHTYSHTLTHTHTHTHTHTLGRTPWDQGPASCPDFYLHNSQHSQKTDIQGPPVGFEPTIPASERPRTHALDRAATGIGNWKLAILKYYSKLLLRINCSIIRKLSFWPAMANKVSCFRRQAWQYLKNVIGLQRITDHCVLTYCCANWRGMAFKIKVHTVLVLQNMYSDWPIVFLYKYN
jgi:hypothetical protein